MANATDLKVFEEKPPYTGYEMPSTGKLYQFYLSQPIIEAEKYTHMIHQIRTAQEGDTILIFLNTPGGDLATGVQIINAMKSTGAKVVTVIDGIVASLGTLIFLAGDEYVVHDNGLFMIHNYSGYTFGKGNEQQAQLSATIKWFDSLAGDLYVPFLSQEEFELVKAGQDLWMLSDEVRTRLHKMVKVIQRQQSAARKASTTKRKPKAKTKKKITDSSEG